jgi:hypothetical protein
VAFQAIWSGYVIHGTFQWQQGNLWLDLAITSLAALVYMPLIMWIGFQLGLRMRTQMQAVLSTFAIIGATCAIPELIGVAIGEASVRGVLGPAAYLALGLSAIKWLSPVQMITGTQSLIIQFRSPWAWVIAGIHFAFYGYLYWRLRRNALQNFSRIVGRLEAGEIEEPTTAIDQKELLDA